MKAGDKMFQRVVGKILLVVDMFPEEGEDCKNQMIPPSLEDQQVAYTSPVCKIIAWYLSIELPYLLYHLVGLNGFLTNDTRRK